MSEHEKVSLEGLLKRAPEARWVFVMMGTVDEDGELRTHYATSEAEASRLVYELSRALHRTHLEIDKIIAEEDAQ